MITEPRLGSQWWLGVVAALGACLVLMLGNPWAGAQDNNPATGEPTISGTVRVGETLTMDVSEIADADGMEDAAFQYIWYAHDPNDPDHEVGTGGYIVGFFSPSTFVVPAWTEGLQLWVRVHFEDDEGNGESVDSAATEMVAASLTKTVPFPPGEIKVSPGASGELEFRWVSGIYTDGGSVITADTVQWKDATDSWGTDSDVSEHEIMYDDWGYAGDYTITGLTDGVAVSVRVIATNSVGDSDPSAEVTAIPGGQFSISGMSHREFGEDSIYASVLRIRLPHPDGTLVITDLAHRYEAHNAASGATIVWSLSGADSDDFTIRSGTAWAWVDFASLPDYDAPADNGEDNRFEVTVEATDGTSTATLAVTVVVTDVDEAPELSGPTVVDYPEGSSGPVAEFTADDPEDATITWSLSGEGSDLFDLSTSGVLTFRTTPDYEQLITERSTNQFVLQVVASDGTYTPATEVTVTVTDVDEDGTVTLTPSQPRVSGTVAAVLNDPDGSVTNIAWQWARSQNRTDWTTIPDQTTSSYTTATADVGYYLRSRVTYDDANGTGKHAEAVSANPVGPTTPPPPPPPQTGGGGGGTAPPAGRPEFTEGSQASRTVPENTAPGVDIGEPVAATDPDDDPLTYTLMGAARDVFDIDPKSGQLLTKATLDYETTHTYTVSVGVRDSKDAEGKPDSRRDDSIRVTVKVSNADEDGWVTLSALTPRVDTPLEAAVADPDGVIGDLGWVWERSSDQATWEPIQDATASAYTPTQADETHYLRVAATYTDGHGPNKTASATADPAVTVGYPTSYTDVTPEGTHTSAITALASDGVFVGTECGPERFCPNEPIQRWVLAVWLIRALGPHPTTTGQSRFADITRGQWWIRYAEQLADLEITAGCGTDPLRYCPDQAVTRAQMASFLVRALDLPPAETPAGFADTQGNTHQDNIDALAAASITVGCGTDPPRFCPDQAVTRAQMAAFLSRALNQRPNAAPITE